MESEKSAGFDTESSVFSGSSQASYVRDSTSGDSGFSDGDFDFDDYDDYSTPNGTNEGTRDVLNSETSTEFGEDDFDDLDDLDDLDAESDDLTNINFKQHKLIETSESVDGGVNVDSLSPEDLMAAMLTVDAENNEEFDPYDDEDLQELSNLQSNLVSAGLEGVDQMQNEQLVELNNRLKKIDGETELTLLAQDFKNSCSEAQSLLATSASTLDTDYDVQKVNALKASVSNDVESAELYSFVQKAMLEAGTDDIDYMAINEKLCRTALYKSLVAKHSSNYIVTTVSVMIDKIRRLNSQQVSEEIHSLDLRDRKAKYILQDEYNDMKLFISNASSGKISFIKQILHKGDDYFLKCNSCGKEFKIAAPPLTILRISTERQVNQLNKSIFRFPHVYTCSCGCGMVLCQSEYDKIVKEFIHVYSKGLNQASQYVISNCKGDAYIKISPSVTMFNTVLPDLVYTNEFDTVEISSNSNTVFNNVIVDDEEMRRASIEFYDSINGLNPQCQKAFLTPKLLKGTDDTACNDYGVGNVSHRMMARLYCDVLSLDYDTEHNKALYSFLYSIKDMPFMIDALDYSKIWQLEIDIAFVSKYTTGSAKSLGESEFKMLKSLATEIDSTSRVVDFNREELLSFLKNHLDDLHAMLTEYKNKRNKFISAISVSIDALAYTNIINVSTFKLEDYDALIPDKDTSNLYNEIADRMILNNYASEFCEYWETLHVINDQAIKKSLKQSAELVKARNSIANAMSKYASTHGTAPFGDEILAFSYPIIEQHEPLRDLVNACRSYNYYRFLKALCNLKYDLNSYVSKSFTNLLANVLTALHDTKGFNLELSEFNFYFSSQFSEDEILELERELDDFKFNRWILNRLPNESVTDYSNRYKDLASKKLLDSSNAVDWKEYFDAIGASLVILLAAACISSMEYKSLTTTLFMSKVVNVALQNMNADELCELFGFATSLYTLVSREDKSNQISDDFDLKADLVKLLRGHYLTGSEILLRDFADEYSQKLLHIAEPLSEKLDILNYANAIATIYDSIPDTDSSLVIDEGSSLDRSEILDDFETYSLKMKSLHAEE